jgi:mono/diheme cytochrome c family protein
LPGRLRLWAVLALWIGGAALAAPIAAMAQDVGDVAAGRRLAETWCSNCHLLETARQATVNGVPTFHGIARMKWVTPLSLRAFLQTPHQRMPDMNLSSDELDDLTAYILSLR